MSETREVPDLFAGAGGWDVAARRLGIETVGFEVDRATCLTRAANGLITVEGDVTTFDPRDIGAAGQIGSPPCQGFSLAGRGQARKESMRLLQLLEGVRTASDVARVQRQLQDEGVHEGLWLVLEPLRWALTTTPTWLAWEQVVAVQPLWEACARILRAVGYSVDTAILTSEMYGVPQTRKRSILVARAPWAVAEHGRVELPKPTHSRYHIRTPDRLDPGVPKWVSMAEALGWDWAFEVESNYGTSGDPKNRGVRTGDQPAATITSKVGRNKITHFGDVGNDRGAVRRLDQPAPTISASADNGNFRFIDEEHARHHQDRREFQEALRGRVKNQSGTEYDLGAQVLTPATAVPAQSRAGLQGFRGPNANRFNDSTKSRNDGIRVSVEEAGILQTFPADYQWLGLRNQRYAQVGNAIPVDLAYAVLDAVVR